MRYLTIEEFEEDIRKNPKKYIGEFLTDKNGSVYEVVGVTSEGIQTQPIVLKKAIAG